MQSNKMTLDDAPVQEEFVEEVERYKTHEGCEFDAGMRFIDEVDDMIEYICSYMKKEKDISSASAELLYKLSPVFRVVTESCVEHNFSEDPIEAQNDYEWKARNFLKDYDYVLALYSKIFENPPDFIRYEVDEDFVSVWENRVYPDEVVWGGFHHWKWSWPDGGWIMCSCEGE